MSTGKTPIANPQTTLLLEILGKISHVEEQLKKQKEEILSGLKHENRVLIEQLIQQEEEADRWESETDEDLCE